jgi:hypothetical protein
MDNLRNNSSSPVARLIPVLLFFIGLIALYYLYQYLFGPRTGNSYELIKNTQNANVDPTNPIRIRSDNLPALYEGGEFTVSTWIYIDNWSYRSGFNKSIISVGGPNFDTLRVYLGGSKPKLFVRLHTTSQGMVTQEKGDSLLKSTESSVFTQLQTESSLLDSSAGCDLPEIELQRWVNISIAVNGKTVDVYIDGKLTRSCILPNFFKVDGSGYSANLLMHGGFGGQISTTMMYDSALHPEAIYKNYIAGPEPITNLGDWLMSIFSFNVNVTVDTK